MVNSKRTGSQYIFIVAVSISSTSWDKNQVSIIHTGVTILFALIYNITEKQFAKGVTLEDMFAHRLPKNMTYYKLWLASRASRKNQIAFGDWLPERARGSYLACVVLPEVSHEKNFPKSHNTKSFID